MSTITFTVTVASSKFLIDGGIAPKLTFRDGDTYVFDQADSSNSGHILQFSATSDNSGSSEYTTGVTKAGTPGSAGGKTTIVTSGSTTDTLYYYCGNHSGMGSEFSNSGFNTTTGGFLKPILGGAGEKWGSMLNHAVDQIDQALNEVEGTAIISTGESGGSKFLREDGDGTSSWVTVNTNSGNEAASTNLTGTITDSYFLSLAYVLTGDVTLSGDTIFAKMIDGTTNVSITNDGSTRTLSGSGTLLVNSVMFN